ncbi:uncharacterized protein J4E84_010027 [Alternaria hordeiaustralica]|uniref:uncharacterized protein n=1 Tax=Alternaria hordeiaustralica TaxID=1187925 RepID=UPI0020C35445|nr:uncharacterized protein J4E84_010027 [Alternaria hordeiaustralica]KAI4620400.1 hypothetical protein J4E80_004926 [Alternaria sp. BMP 0032]KAI4675433.1 hypothetical protein J4E84_010027 [Alternaria hordeiaustralica]KAI4702656.1 hypothetical protein J4E89_010378 [Alternaria sp. Ai002NY15]
MPPALSDHGSSDAEDVPAQPRKGKGKQPVQEDPIDDEEDEDDSEVGEDEYVVEAIHGHRFTKGVLQFDVKWEGYDDPKDRTWEAEENMEGAIDVLNEYFKKIGGRPEPKGQKRKGRPSTAGIKSESGTPSSSTKRAKADKPEKKVAEWSPPPGSWEHDVDHIDTVEQTKDPKTGQLEKFAYLVWTNKQKTQHPLKHVYQKCPQKMLEYYESHLVFTENVDEPLNGDDTNDTVMNDD